MEQKDGLNHLIVQVTPKRGKEDKSKQPNAIALLIDNSGSMDGLASQNERASKKDNPFSVSGFMDKMRVGRTGFGHQRERAASKLDYVKQAALSLVDQLHDGDLLTIITFSHQADLLQPVVRITPKTREMVKNQIRKIKTIGTTNISAAYELAAAELLQVPKEFPVRTLLLSDGEANGGITDPELMTSYLQEYRKRGWTVSTIGVGIEYNSFFMEKMATATGGFFYHLQEMEQLQGIFLQELKVLRNTSTRQAELRLSASGGVKIGENLNGYFEPREGAIFLGDILYQQEIVVELKTDQTDSSSSVIEVEYHFSGEEGAESLRESLSLPLVSDEEMDDVIIHKKWANMVEDLMHASIRQDAVRALETYDSNQVTEVQQRAIKRLQSTATYDKVLQDDDAVLEKRKKLESFIEELPKKLYQQDRNENKTLYSASYTMLRKKE